VLTNSRCDGIIFTKYLITMGQGSVGKEINWLLLLLFIFQKLMLLRLISFFFYFYTHIRI